jgi:hypothetical protein
MALVMRYYKRGSVGATFGTPTFGTIGLLGRTQLALQVGAVCFVAITCASTDEGGHK